MMLPLDRLDFPTLHENLEFHRPHGTVRVLQESAVVLSSMTTVQQNPMEVFQKRHRKWLRHSTA